MFLGIATLIIVDATKRNNTISILYEDNKFEETFRNNLETIKKISGELILVSGIGLIIEV